MVAWQDIPWKQIHRHVFRLPKRIYRAAQDGRVRIAQPLQKLWIKSWYARLLAGRRVTQDNQGHDVYTMTFVVLGDPAYGQELGRPGSHQQSLKLAYCADITTT